MLTGNFQDLSENVKTFIDDLTDYQIINISKRTYRYDLIPHQLVNRHGNYMTGLYTKDLLNIQDYCKYLIEIGAVKSVEALKTLQPVLDDGSNATA